MKILLYILSISLLVFACKKKQDNTIIYGYEYFPINEGNYVVYDVVDIFHDIALAPAHDTMRYQIKEVIGEELIDGEGEKSHKLRRYFRDNDSSSWTIKDVWTIKRTSTTGEVVNENGRIIALIFAIAYDRTWNCNALNNNGELTCYYEDIYLPYALPSLEFDSTIRVEKENFISFIDFKRSYNVYAANIGKVQSVMKDLQIDNEDTLDIVKGAELFYTAIEFGVE
jgi:hypothetical protein